MNSSGGSVGGNNLDHEEGEIVFFFFFPLSLHINFRVNDLPVFSLQVVMEIYWIWKVMIWMLVRRQLNFRAWFINPHSVSKSCLIFLTGFNENVAPEANVGVAGVNIPQFRGLETGRWMSFRFAFLTSFLLCFALWVYILSWFGFFRVRSLADSRLTYVGN